MSVQFNVFRHSCELRHPIAHGTLTVTYSAATRAHKTIETYEILGTPYEVTGWLVQPDSTYYRIFGTHSGSRTTVAQVMLVAQTGSLYLGRKKGHEHLKGQIRELQGVLLDVHNHRTIYATRVLIRRPDQDHPRLSPGLLTCNSGPLFDDVRRALEHKNMFDTNDVIGFR